MGALADIQSNKKTFKIGSPLDAWLTSEIAKRVDADVPSAAAAADGVYAQAQSTQSSGNHTLTIAVRENDGSVTSFTTANIAYNLAGGGTANAVHTIAQDATDHTGGTFTLTITLSSGETFTTAGIAYNANAATIESAIDTAASGVVPGWSNGHISVSGGILQAAGADVVLTFDGASVSGDPNHVLTVFDGSSLTGGTEPATRVTNTTVGVQSIVNNAALGSGIAYGEIVVGGTSVDDASGLTYTFSGANVTSKPITVTLTDVDGAGGAWGAVTKTTRGQTKRAALGALLNLGILSGSIPEQDAVAAEGVFTIGTNLNAVPDVTVKALMREAAAEDANNGVYFSLEDTIFNQDRAPLVETRLTSDVLPE